MLTEHLVRNIEKQLAREEVSEGILRPYVVQRLLDFPYRLRCHKTWEEVLVEGDRGLLKITKFSAEAFFTDPVVRARYERPSSTEMAYSLKKSENRLEEVLTLDSREFSSGLFPVKAFLFLNWELPIWSSPLQLDENGLESKKQF
jgi:hypothetical protein